MAYRCHSNPVTKIPYSANTNISVYRLLWCPWRASNPHDICPRCLRPLRLPIPTTWAYKASSCKCVHSFQLVIISLDAGNEHNVKANPLAQNLMKPYVVPPRGGTERDPTVVSRRSTNMEVGAGNGIRTHTFTGLKSDASSNCAIPACYRSLYYRETLGLNLFLVVPLGIEPRTVRL